MILYDCGTWSWTRSLWALCRFLIARHFWLWLGILCCWSGQAFAIERAGGFRSAITCFLRWSWLFIDDWFVVGVDVAAEVCHTWIAELQGVPVETQESYAKPNNTPLYVHRDSDHPPSILGNIPLAINKRLSEILSTREAFERVAPEYQEALNKSGYDHQLRYQPTTAQPWPGPRKWQRNITWYNPLYSQSVATNVGKKFLGIVNNTFKKDHPLRKIFTQTWTLYPLTREMNCQAHAGMQISFYSPTPKLFSKQVHAGTLASLYLAAVYLNCKFEL